MDTDLYDIFLSYRRRGGFETAKHLFDLLTRDGYSVSFDIDTLRSGDFDTTLLRRIDQCTDFILILDREAFDRTLDPAFDRNKDWMRIELAYALEKGKNIIPVMLSGFTEFPDNLPVDIAAVIRKNGPKYDQYYFDAFYAKLLRFLDSRPSERRSVTSGGPAAGSSTLKIRCDIDCCIFVDDEERGIAQAGQLFRLPLRGGSYILRFVSVDNPADTVEETLRIEKDVEELYRVALLPVRRQREDRETAARAEERRRREEQERIRAEEEKQLRREAYLLQLPDERFKSVKDNGLYGFLDSENNELLIPYAYDYAAAFRKGLAKVEKGRKCGYIDKLGKVVIPIIYDDASPLNEGLAKVKKDGKYGYIDKTGKLLAPLIYDDVGPFSEGLAWVRKDEKYGYIDKAGREVVPVIYDDANDFSKDLAPIEKNGKWGYIDKTGREVIPCAYDNVSYFFEGLAAIKKGWKWGYIDKTGREVIPLIYGSANDFSEGLALVMKNWKYGYIDKTGRWVRDA